MTHAARLAFTRLPIVAIAFALAVALSAAALIETGSCATLPLAGVTVSQLPPSWVVMVEVKLKD